MPKRELFPVQIRYASDGCWSTDLYNLRGDRISLRHSNSRWMAKRRVRKLRRDAAKGIYYAG